MLRPPIREAPLRGYLVLLALAFQLKLENRFVEGVEQAGSLQIVNPRKIAPRREAEVE